MGCNYYCYIFFYFKTIILPVNRFKMFGIINNKSFNARLVCTCQTKVSISVYTNLKYTHVLCNTHFFDYR